MKAIHITDIKVMMLKLNEIIEHENQQLEALESKINEDPEEQPFDDNNTRADSIESRIDEAQSAVLHLECIVELASKYEPDP